MKKKIAAVAATAGLALALAGPASAEDSGLELSTGNTEQGNQQCWGGAGKEFKNFGAVVNVLRTGPGETPVEALDRLAWETVGEYVHETCFQDNNQP
jgi:hypothetical protein